MRQMLEQVKIYKELCYKAEKKISIEILGSSSRARECWVPRSIATLT